MIDIYTFLSVSRCKFIADLWYPNASYAYLAELVAVAVECKHHLIDYTSLTVTKERRAITFGITFRRAVQL